MRKLLFVSLGGLLLLALAAWIAHSRLDRFENSPHEGLGKLVAVDIPKGAGPKQISKLLEQKGVISDADFFYIYIRYLKRKAGSMKAGELAFRDNMTPGEVLQVLIQGTPINHKVTIAEGLRSDEMAVLFERAGFASAEQFERRVKDPDFVKSFGVDASSLEGFLYPDTYHFRKDTPLDDIITTLVSAYKRIYTDKFRIRAKELGMSEMQVVTLASIVEKETAVGHERPLIAGVFHNRLKMGWRLDTDPTVIYAVLLSRGSFNGNLTRADLAMDHPYNTYRNPGLPPGPICNPGQDAIQAVLYPTETKHMFFVSKNDGTHHFCPNLACHEKAVRQFQGGS